MQIKAISTVVASILMLMIVIALGGVSYAFISGVFTGSTATAFELIDAYNDTITIRNIGTETIQDLTSVRVDENSRRDWFFDDFEDGQLDWWTQFFSPPRWAITDISGDKKLVSVVANPGAVLLEGVELDNFILDIDLKGPSAGTGAALYFRLKDDNNHYHLLFFRQTDEVELLKRTGGATSSLTGRVQLPSGMLLQENKIRIIASGSSIKIFINDAPVIDVQDNTFSSGKFQLFASSIDATIDDVKINPYIVPGGTATFKVYDPLSKGTHTVRLCTSSMCNTGHITIQ